MIQSAIQGAGGGGGSQSQQAARSPVEAPDSLQSKALVSIIDLIGEGEIGGLVDGAKSIYLNNTPIQNKDGAYAFAGVKWDSRTGRPDQTPMAGFSNIETPHSVGAKLQRQSPMSFSISNPETDAVRIITTIPSLYEQNATTGDVSGAEIAFLIEISKDGGPFSAVGETNYGKVWCGGANVSTSGNRTTVIAEQNGTRVSCNVVVSATETGVLKLRYRKSTLTSSDNWIEKEFKVSTQAQLAKRMGVFTFNPLKIVGFSPEKKTVVQQSYDSEGVRTDLPQDGTVQAGQSDSYGAPATPEYIVTPAKEYYKIEVEVISKPAGFTMSVVDTKSFRETKYLLLKGKTRSRYQRAYQFDLPKPANSWVIRVSRLTPDSTSPALQNDLYLDSYIEIVDSKLSYPNSALVGLSIDATQFNSIPNRSYLIDGVKIRVPSNYNPTARSYSGIWNGTFVTAVSSNPAWIMYDLLTNPRYGLGEFLSESQIDKAKLYQIGRYCDELVPNGAGGVEPRFSCNTCFTTRTEAYKLLSDLSSVFRGMGFWDGSLVSFTQDSPSDPTMIYGPSNVIGGDFTYTGSSRKDRHSVALVTWNDPVQNYKQVVEYVENPKAIEAFGVRQVETVALGCTSRSQANRVGRWILLSEESESNVVSFGVGIDSLRVAPGHIIRINDPHRSGERSAGRIRSATMDEVVLDAPLSEAFTPSTLSVRLEDGEFVDRGVLSVSGDRQTLTLSEPLPSAPLRGAMWMASSESVKPMLARVVSIAQGSEKNQFTISAVEHDPTKYDRIDADVKLSESVAGSLTAVPNPPTEVIVVDGTYVSGANTITKLDISWDDMQKGVTSWIIKVKEDYGNWVTYSQTSRNLVIDGVRDGAVYAVEVYSVSISGAVSVTSTSGTHLVIGSQTPPPDVMDMRVTAEKEELVLRWQDIAIANLDVYEVRLVDAAWGTIDDNRIYSDIGKVAYYKPKKGTGDVTFYLRARDAEGHYSSMSSRYTYQITPPGTPELPTIKIAGVKSQTATLSLTWPEVAQGSFKIAGYEIRSTDVEAEWGSAGAVAISEGTARAITIAGVSHSEQTTWYMRAFDVLGNYGPSLTMTYNGSAPPASVTGLTIPAVAKGQDIEITWDDVDDLDLNFYEVRRADSNWGKSAGRLYKGRDNACFDRAPKIGGTYYVKACDLYGKYSEIASSVVFTYPTPPVPETFNITFDFGSETRATVTLDWDDVEPFFGLDKYEITWPGQAKPIFVKASNYDVQADWSGERVFSIRVKDRNGKFSDYKTVSGTINSPKGIATTNLTVEQIGFTKGKATVKLDWEATGLVGTLPVRGYEVRATDSGWGTTAKPVYKGDASTCVVNGVSPFVPTTWYIRAYDSAKHYSPTSLVATFAPVYPPDATSLTVTRKGSDFILTAKGVKPSDFKCFEFRVGQVRVGATTGDDAIDAVIAGASDIWDDPDCVRKQTTTESTKISINEFPSPRFLSAGVVYRFACRMIDTSDNASMNSILTAKAVKSLK